MTLYEEPHAPRRVITGIRDGRSVFVSDARVPNAHHYTAIPGMFTSIVYRTASPPSLPEGDEETAPPGGVLLPAPGETSLVILTLPPDAVYARPGIDLLAADKEQFDFAPDFGARFERDHPGKHTTDSLDYDIVLEGEVWLELDDETKHLRAGDVVVQAGTRHAWRNKGNAPATLAFVLIGVQPR